MTCIRIVSISVTKKLCKSAHNGHESCLLCWLDPAGANGAQQFPPKYVPGIAVQAIRR
jgi:hypothetical protein